jgi:hypothetical protein
MQVGDVISAKHVRQATNMDPETGKATMWLDWSTRDLEGEKYFSFVFLGVGSVDEPVDVEEVLRTLGWIRARQAHA